jgi:hypothetical protein
LQRGQAGCDGSARLPEIEPLWNAGGMFFADGHKLGVKAAFGIRVVVRIGPLSNFEARHTGTSRHDDP